MSDKKEFTNWGIGGEISGFLANDPDYRFTTGGTAVCSILIPAKTDMYGEEKPVTSWARITFWGEKAEAVNQLRKGDLVRVRFYKGYIRTYAGRNGPGATLEAQSNELRIREEGTWKVVVAREPRFDPNAGYLANNREVDEPPPGFEEDDIPF